MSKEKILILSVGGSEEPLIFSINTFKPDKVVFLHSRATLYQCGKILEKVQWKNNDELIVGLSNLFKKYKNSFFEIFREILPNFLSYEVNDEFYVNFIDFLDRNYFKDVEDFNYKFLDFLYSLKIEKNFYIEFSDLINKNLFDTEKFYLTISDESKMFKENIDDYINKNMPSILNQDSFDNIVFRAEIKDHESLDNSFSVSKKVFNNFNDDSQYEVIVDFTGGTKPMVSGVVLAVVEGNFTNFEFRYVGSEHSARRTKKGLGIVEDGSEITKLQYNPYEKYGITEFKRGKNFFNTYQFESAATNFENAFNSLEEGPEKELSKYYLQLSNFYQSWDKFNSKIKVYNEELNKYESKKLSTYLQKELIEKCPKDLFLDDFKSSEEFLNQMNNNLEFLRLKLANDKSKGIEYYLPDLLNNACRKIEEGFYDDGVARLYRAIELIAQINLNRLDIIDQQKLKDNNAFHINRKQFLLETMDKPKIRTKVERWHIKDYEDKEKTFKLALAKSYDLLKAFDVQLARDYFADKKLEDAVKNKRNNSILAHGLDPLDYDSAKDFYKRVLSYSIKAFPDIEDYMDKAQFPKFE